MTPVTICKTDRSLGLIIGWALVSTIAGKPYFDRQGDHVPDDQATKAFARFMEGDRILKLNHTGSVKGRVIFCFPLSADIARSVGIQTQQTGVLIGVKPDDPAILDMFDAGRIGGFSIGGRGTKTETVH
ncbi:XkdF-like putative serine protease domain-containing protein [Mesorhizobium sp. CCNWLW179-1]|uniref:XkdF-like putative serine protease domain-containing protein n=1 Tax=Mesorhizobium sp. CCNWLW179-1 TaxID=3136721 RepID=UPI0030142BBF